MTEKTLDWLNQNRFRAYPLVNDEGLVGNGVRAPDCVLLDCLVMDTRRGAGHPELRVTKVDVLDDRTKVEFSYGGSTYSHTLLGGEESGPGSVVRVRGEEMGLGGEFLYVSLTFSSHAYILAHAGKGTWTFNGRALPSRIVATEASGVSAVRTLGSTGVPGRAAGAVSGDVHLVDGFRTQPVVKNGRVVVMVGNQYGEDPCVLGQQHAKVDCDDLMLFFCGQNAINSGNVVLKGGPGVGVRQGVYKAKTDIIDSYGNVGIAAGEEVPCIEVVASSELLRIYRPLQGSGSSGSGGSGGSDSPEAPES